MPASQAAPERGRLEHLRPVDRGAENIGEKLHGPVRGASCRHRRAAPHRRPAPAQSARIASSRSRVWKPTLSSAARASSAGPELRVRPKIAPRASGRPVRRAKPGEGGHQNQLLRRIGGLGQRLASRPPSRSASARRAAIAPRPPQRRSSLRAHRWACPPADRRWCPEAGCGFRTSRSPVFSSAKQPVP